MGESGLTSVQAAPRRISDEMRVALDVIRAVAAVYVVIHHVAAHSTLSGPLSYPFRFGQEAVIVFFLLSGFLIYASEQNRVRSGLRGYYLRRLRRIYPTLLVAMGITALVVWLNGTLAQAFNMPGLVLNLLSLQDVSALKPGVIVDPFLGNSPLWSLSYEVFFYLVFPLVMVARRASRAVALTAVGALSVAGYASFLILPNHFSLVVSYLLVWWAGAVVADLYRSNQLNFRDLLPTLGWLCGLILVAAGGVALYGSSDVGVFPILPIRHLLFTLLCVVLCLTVVAKALVEKATRLARPAAYVASISYGLYVFHYPLLIQWEAARTPTGFILATVALIACAVVGDRVLEKRLPRPSK